MTDVVKELQKKINKNSILVNEPMSKHTSIKIGGNADFFVRISNIEELKYVLEFSKKNNIPVTIVGNGSNLIVRDKGIRGIVLKLELNEFKIKKENYKTRLTIGSGFPVSKLSNIALKEELSGLEFLAGIPGTIGGAIRMNAGAHGKEMSNIVISTKYIDRDGKIKNINNEEHKFTHRDSIFSSIDVIIIETVLEVQNGNEDEIKCKIDEYLKYRKEKQPIEYPNSGSVFKKSGEISTAKLIDDCGLKGYRIGDAMISEKHAGFIVNVGKAKAKDVIDLINYAKEKIKEKYNKEIETEVLIIGEE